MGEILPIKEELSENAGEICLGIRQLQDNENKGEEFGP